MWSDDLLLGNMVIDKQHKHLFTIVGGLLETYSNHDNVDKNTLIQTLNFLKEYTINHFDYEEKLQVSAKYSGYEEHKKLHKNLLDKLNQHERALIESDFSKEELKTFASTLVSWLTHHVGVEDKKINLKDVYVGT